MLDLIRVCSVCGIWIINQGTSSTIGLFREIIHAADPILTGMFIFKSDRPVCMALSAVDRCSTSFNVYLLIDEQCCGFDYKHKGYIKLDYVCNKLILNNS